MQKFPQIYENLSQISEKKIIKNRNLSNFIKKNVKKISLKISQFAPLSPIISHLPLIFSSRPTQVANNIKITDLCGKGEQKRNEKNSNWKQLRNIKSLSFASVCHIFFFLSFRYSISKVFFSSHSSHVFRMCLCVWMCGGWDQWEV